MKTYAFLLIFLVAGRLFSETASDSIRAATGDVRVEFAGKSHPAQKGERLPQNATVRTGSNGICLLALAAGHQLKLLADSEIHVTADPRSARVELRSGGVFAKVRKLLDTESFSLQSGSMLCGVRGTEFFAGRAPTAQGQKHWLCVREGVVLVSASTGEAKPVKAGEGVAVAEGGPVSAPKAFAWTQKLNWDVEDLDPARDGSKFKKWMTEPAAK